MRVLVRWIVVAALGCIYLLALFAMLHPKVSQAYRLYYIDHTASDWNPPRYSATPEQGMTFSRGGLPDWVDTTYGLSIREDGGRWTDNDISKIPGLAFTRKFGGSLCLEFTASPAQSLIGRTFAVQMGNQTKSLPVIPQDLAKYQVQFTDLGETDRLRFLLPQKLPRESEVYPGSRDTRRLGLYLVTLQILPGSCATPQ